MLSAFAIIAGGIALLVYGITRWDRLTAARRWASVEGEIFRARVVEAEYLDNEGNTVPCGTVFGR